MADYSHGNFHLLACWLEKIGDIVVHAEHSGFLDPWQEEHELVVSP